MRKPLSIIIAKAEAAKPTHIHALRTSNSPTHEGEDLHNINSHVRKSGAKMKRTIWNAVGKSGPWPGKSGAARTIDVGGMYRMSKALMARESEGKREK